MQRLVKRGGTIGRSSQEVSRGSWKAPLTMAPAPKRCGPEEPRRAQGEPEFAGKIMKVSVFGLGYVGCVSAACFADAGNEVAGVDVNQVKVDIINSGRSPIVEPGIEELIGKAVAAG